MASGAFMMPSTLSVSLSQDSYQRSAGIHGLAPRMYNSKWESLLQRRIKHLQCLVPAKRTKIIQALAIPDAPASLDNAECRKRLAESYGYTQIGEPLPGNVTLKDIVETIPKKLYEIDHVKSLKALSFSVGTYALGLFMTSQAPWYLLPFAWALTGTAASGLFCIGHDCGHKSFWKNKLVEDIIGTLVFLPLIYPYEGWRFEHDRHHAKTNMLHEDSGWHPIWREDFETSPLARKAMIYGYGLLRPWMTIAHWLMWHFDSSKFRPNEAKRVKLSVACVYAFMAIGCPLLIYETGVTGLINYWLMPWLVFHFWMSTVTMIHHSSPHIPFKSPDEWNPVKAQFSGTTHCDFPYWIEEFLHHINVHLPHHLVPKIPSYNLRAAHESLRENWGKYISEANWNWRLMKMIMTECHVHNPEQNYVAFDELAPEEAGSVSFIRKMMPDWT
ncbi:omega-6 fatty acid desaturase, chloroplastic-like [Malania oleifera]|uniref:omega-6 fatty acid desaturase, chloroplastic-like n=1 Tax=Malania oleifera TaxID=397392 RepID=UPI0025ADCCCA|nr:omega-6 fatty acid desaturase, chloroplastic-like [Malania oleifera]XP_057969789.1 omega-6 fatty acid desaturase, chloroplastic-like [Malania oleifera]